MNFNLKKEKNSANKCKGFTLIELMVTVGIFALMTALLLAKYGTFNQGLLLTNLAYDVALTIRNAQSYGLNVKSAVRDDNFFEYPFGVHFREGQQFIFFADKNIPPNYSYDGSSEDLSITNIKGASKIDDICSGTESSCDNGITKLDIIFKRPDPSAIIMTDISSSQSYAEITLKASDGSVKKVIIRKTGQITVE